MSENTPFPSIKGRYFCENCTGRYEQSGDCPKCEDEPLLDLGDENVRLMLVEMDEKSQSRRYKLLLTIAIVATMPLSLYFVLVRFGMLYGVVASSGVVFGTTAALAHFFSAKNKAPYIGEDELAQWT